MSGDPAAIADVIITACESPLASYHVDPQTIFLDATARLKVPADCLAIPFDNTQELVVATEEDQRLVHASEIRDLPILEGWSMLLGDRHH
jgi:hypothetical protein